LVHKALLLVYLLLNSFLNLILPYIRLTSQTCKRMCLGVYQGVPTEFPSIHKTGASSCYGKIRLFLYITYLFYTISFTCHAMYTVLLSYCLKCLIQIFDDIVNVLSTDRKTDGVRVDALLFQLFFCQLCMSSRSWMDNQRLNICYVCK